MANIHLLFNPASDSGEFSGGSWVPSLPLTNVQTQQPTEVARSTNALTTSTRFVIDLGAATPTDMFALIAHNLSSAATVRIRVASDAAGTTDVDLDTEVEAAQYVPWGSMAWGEFPWDGILEDDLPGGRVLFYKHSELLFRRYVLIDIDDTTNEAGYVQIGRVMVGTAFSPEINIAWGARFGFIDESQQSRSKGGQDYFDRAPLRRYLSCTFDALRTGESLGSAWDMMRRLGTTRTLLAVYDPDDDASVLWRRTIYGRNTSLSPIIDVRPDPHHPHSWALDIEETL